MIVLPFFFTKICGKTKICEALTDTWGKRYAAFVFIIYSDGERAITAAFEFSVTILITIPCLLKQRICGFPGVGERFCRPFVISSTKRMHR